MKEKLNIKGMFITAGALVSFNVGAGFASGNELLQFFGPWGSGAVAEQYPVDEKGLEKIRWYLFYSHCKSK